MAWRLGVDTGGTFTDVCLVDTNTQQIAVAKATSTPDDPGEAVLTAIREAFATYQTSYGISAGLSSLDHLAHGTTVATNALLEERGANIGLVTTRGFRDLLELARQKRPSLYKLAARKPATLVQRSQRLEVTERVNHEGSVLTPLDEVELRGQVRRLLNLGVEAVAVCFLYSYLNPSHEETARKTLAEECPDLFVSISTDVVPEFREYERLSTTVINAFVGPVMQRYLSRLHRRLKESGLATSPVVTQSNGAVMPFEQAQHFPVKTLLSGPSTGVVGSAKLAQQVGFPNVITFDMGGTSSDVALVQEGEPKSSNGMTLDGRPVNAAMLDINTVGAGGGSVAWIDSGQHLKVGPQSAGASPGPACYGLGNAEPTVTDANVVLGILNQKALLGGAMPIDAGLAKASVRTLAERLGMSTTEVANGILNVVTANMARAIRVISVQRGYDPADYALVAFGGAGPLHAGRLARELGMRHVIIPPNPGAQSAFGMLMTELRADFSKTHVRSLIEDNLPTIQSVWMTLETQAHEWSVRQGRSQSDLAVRRLLDVRYEGQNYELTLQAPTTACDADWLAEVAELFHNLHDQRYGYHNPGHTVELVTFRLDVRIEVPTISYPEQETTNIDDRQPQPADIREIVLPGTRQPTQCPTFLRSDLQTGDTLHGPLVIEQYDSTTLVLPEQSATVTPSQSLLVSELN